MKKLKLITAFVALAMFVSICIVSVKLILRGIYYILDHSDYSGVIWFALIIIVFAVVYRIVNKLEERYAEDKKIRSMFLTDEEKQILYNDTNGRFRIEQDRNQKIIEQLRDSCQYDINDNEKELSHV